MTIRIGDWFHAFDGRVATGLPPDRPAIGPDVLSGRPGVVIPLGRAAVCGEDHVYDLREFRVCPNCASEERLPLSTVLAQRHAVPRTAPTLAAR